MHDGDTDDNDDVDDIMMIKTTLLTHKSHFDSFKGVVFLTPRRLPQESHFDFFWVDTCKESFYIINPLNRVILTTYGVISK